MLKVRDLMSRRLLTLRENASVGLADAEMLLAQIRHFPVVDEGGELVGMMTETDFLRVAAKALTPRRQRASAPICPDA